MCELHGVLLLKELRDRVRYYRATHDKLENYHTKWMRSVIKAWENEEMHRRIANHIEQSVQFASARNASVIVIILPELNDLEDTDKFGLPRQKLRKTLEQLQIEYCDLYETFYQAAEPSSYFLPGDNLHFSVRGHQLAAEAVASCWNKLPK